VTAAEHGLTSPISNLNNRVRTRGLRAVVASKAQRTLTLAIGAQPNKIACVGTVRIAQRPSIPRLAHTLIVNTRAITTACRGKHTVLFGAVIPRKSILTHTHVVVAHSIAVAVIGAGGAGTRGPSIAWVAGTHATLHTSTSSIAPLGTVGLIAEIARPQVVAHALASNTRAMRLT